MPVAITLLMGSGRADGKLPLVVFTFPTSHRAEVGSDLRSHDTGRRRCRAPTDGIAMHLGDRIGHTEMTEALI